MAAPGDEALGTALTHLGPVEVIRPEAVRAWLMRSPRPLADRLVARASALPQPAEQGFAVLAQTGDGRTLARAEGMVAGGADAAEAEIQLPAELRNQLARLVLAGVPSAGAVMLLDEGRDGGRSAWSPPGGVMTSRCSARSTTSSARSMPRPT